MRNIFISFFLLGLMISSAKSANIVWLGAQGNPASNNWSEPLNWQGGVIPGADDVAVFNSNEDCNLDQEAIVRGVLLVSTYTGTIIHRNLMLCVGSDGFIVESGTPGLFQAGVGDIYFSSFVDLNTGFNSGSGTITFGSCSSSHSLTFTTLKTKLDGGIHQLDNGQLNFLYREEYSVSSTSHLEYRIYDHTRTIVLGSDKTGISLADSSPIKPISYGYNTISFDVGAALPSGQIYTLEVQNQKGEKQYLKFTF